MRFGAWRGSPAEKNKKRIIGFNYRLGEFQAAVLGAQLARMPKQSAIREQNMKRFEARMAKTPGIGLLKPDPRITRLAPYGYVMKYFAEKVGDIPRAAFVAAMRSKGAHCDGVFYARGYKSALFP